jgi:hypothetical protein
MFVWRKKLSIKSSKKNSLLPRFEKRKTTTSDLIMERERESV